MTASQLAALRALATGVLMPGAITSAADRRINTRAASALVKQGLARRVPQKWGGVVVPNAFEYVITPAGRKALAKEKS